MQDFSRLEEALSGVHLSQTFDMKNFANGYRNSSKYAEDYLAKTLLTISKCMICLQPLTFDDAILSHFVSERTLRLIADRHNSVNFLSSSMGDRTDFKSIRAEVFSKAGTRIFAHSECDNNEFTPYEDGDLSSDEAAYALIRKNLYLREAQIIERIGQVHYNTEDDYKLTHRQASTMFMGDNWLEDETAKIDRQLEVDEIKAVEDRAEEFKLIREFLELDLRDFKFVRKFVPRIIDIAFQGCVTITGPPSFGKELLFVAYFPIDEVRSFFFLATRDMKKYSKGTFDNRILDTAENVPIIGLLEPLAFDEKQIFWKPGAISGSFESFLKRSHKPLNPDSRNWNDPSMWTNIMPENLTAQEHAALSMIMNDKLS